MIQVINSIFFILSAALMSLLYIFSVQPARLEQRLGAKAYPVCRNLRIAASGFEIIAVACYFLYFFFPFKLPGLNSYPWPYWVSAAIGIITFVPSVVLMGIGLKHAGAEAMSPKKEHTMYGGIYRKIRHPQAVGEVFIWPAVALLLHSPFLTLVSLIWFPLFYLYCFYEEKDLLLRYGDAYARYRKEVGMFIPHSRPGVDLEI